MDVTRLRTSLRAALVLLGLFYSGFGWAVCPSPGLTDPARVRLTAASVMIVVHASSTYDARISTKRGLDEAVRFAKSHKIPLVYLVDDSPLQYYFMEDCNPDYWVFSQGGEISFEAAPTHVYIVGGHLELCMSATLHDVLHQWSRRPPRNFRVTYLMDAIYSNGKTIDESAPFYRDFTRFMDVVTYGRPGGEHWPKLTMLETMGVIVREEHELNYLSQILPRWDRSFPSSYRIEMQLNDSVKKVLRPAPGWNPPTVSFHFLDSVLNLAEPQGRISD